MHWIKRHFIAHLCAVQVGNKVYVYIFLSQNAVLYIINNNLKKFLFQCRLKAQRLSIKRVENFIFSATPLYLTTICIHMLRVYSAAKNFKDFLTHAV